MIETFYISNMKTNRLLVVILLFAFPLNLLLGQDKEVQGLVTMFDSIALAEVSVEVKSTGEIVLTDSLGNFRVHCQPKDKLKFTANGFSTINVRLNEEIRIVLVNMKLKPGPENQEIALGYGHIRDEEKLDAVVTLTQKQFDFSVYSNVFEAIKGRFPGVQVRGNDIFIRGGSNSINLSTEALLILDGMEVDGGNLATTLTIDIKSISVLKGPSAAIYGSRGANGVVIVETMGRRD